MTPGPAQPPPPRTESVRPGLPAFSLADVFAASPPTSPRPARSPPTLPRPAPAGAESPSPLLTAMEDFPPWGLAAAAVIADAMGGGAVGRWQAQLSAAALPPDGCEDGCHVASGGSDSDWPCTCWELLTGGWGEGADSESDGSGWGSVGGGWGPA